MSIDEEQIAVCGFLPRRPETETASSRNLLFKPRSVAVSNNVNPQSVAHTLDVMCNRLFVSMQSGFETLGIAMILLGGIHRAGRITDPLHCPLCEATEKKARCLSRHRARIHGADNNQHRGSSQSCVIGLFLSMISALRQGPSVFTASTAADETTC